MINRLASPRFMSILTTKRNRMIRSFTKYVILAFLASTYKTLPFAYLLRFYHHVLITLLWNRKKYLASGSNNTFGITGKSNKRDLFKWVGIKSYVSPLEVDMYMHKSNSTYLIDLDIARTKMVCQVFQKLFFNCYFNVHGDFKAQSIANFPYIPAANVQCAFIRELKPFQKFEIHSRVLAWDKKWLFVLSKFTSNNGRTLHTIAITKYVFKKKQRITIVPEEYIKECGLWNEEVAAENETNFKLVLNLVSNDGLEKICKSF